MGGAGLNDRLGSDITVQTNEIPLFRGPVTVLRDSLHQTRLILLVTYVRHSRIRLRSRDLLIDITQRWRSPAVASALLELSTSRSSSTSFLFAFRRSCYSAHTVLRSSVFARALTAAKKTPWSSPSSCSRFSLWTDRPLRRSQPRSHPEVRQ